MKFLYFLGAVFVITVQGFPGEFKEVRWPSKQKVLIEKSQKYSNSADKPDRIHFYLFTSTNNRSIDIDMNDPETLVRSSFDFRDPTVFMIPGWKDGSTAEGHGLKDGLFKNGNFNFIFVDWKIYSFYEAYIISQKLCPKAGKIVAEFIDWMHDHAKMRFDTLTLFGHSMGAHVAGFAGKNVKRGKIHAIFGMDPALPLFPYNDPTRRLAATDAEYVESIHTNGGDWGFYQPIGQTAFYPNGGKYQPGCENDSNKFCSHIRAGLFMIEAINSLGTNDFLAVKCERFEDVEEGKCDQYETVIRMGDPSNANKPRGIYYLKTNSDSPYARGMVDISAKNQKIKKNTPS